MRSEGLVVLAARCACEAQDSRVMWDVGLRVKVWRVEAREFEAMQCCAGGCRVCRCYAACEPTVAGQRRAKEGSARLHQTELHSSTVRPNGLAVW